MHNLIIVVLTDVAYLFTIEPFDYVFACVIVALCIIMLKRIVS